MMIIGLIGYICTSFISLGADLIIGIKIFRVFEVMFFILFLMGTLIEVRDMRHLMNQTPDQAEVLSKYQQENNALIAVSILLMVMMALFIAFWIIFGGF
jgi:hypothetical protein